MLEYFTLILLFITIIYLLKLNKKIISLKFIKEDLSTLMQGFDEIILRTEIGINDLKQLNNDTSRDLQQKIERASSINTDLAYMTDRAIELSDKLERSMTLGSKPNTKTEGPSLHYKHLLAKDPELYIDNSVSNNIDEVMAVSTPKQSAFVSRNSNLDSLLQNITNLREESSKQKQAIKNNENEYKPILVRQNDYYKSLKKV